MEEEQSGSILIRAHPIRSRICARRDVVLVVSIRRAYHDFLLVPTQPLSSFPDCPTDQEVVDKSFLGRVIRERNGIGYVYVFRNKINFGGKEGAHELNFRKK